MGDETHKLMLLERRNNSKVENPNKGCNTILSNSVYLNRTKNTSQGMHQNADHQNKIRHNMIYGNHN